MGRIVSLSHKIKSALQTIKASFFEGARPTKASREFSMAGTTSFEELAQDEREAIRARARWLKANNPLMYNIDQTLVNNTFRGMHIRFDDDVAQKLFDKWARAKQCDTAGKNSFYDIICLADLQRYPDGEVFLYKSYKGGQLKLRLFTADHIDETKGVNGLEINRDGKVTGYWVYENNPTDNFKGFRAYMSSLIPSKNIIHYFRQTDVSQYRGISEYARVIFDLKNQMAFTTTSMEAMIAKAAQAYTVTRSGDVSSFRVDGELQRINGAVVNYLNKGEEIKMHESSTTPINYREFMTSSIRICCTGREVSYELGMRDYSNVNFTSSRAGKIEDNKTIDSIQALGLNKLINPILEAWAEIEFLKGNLKTPEVPHFYLVFPVREWVRPKEDLDYHLTAIENKVGTKDDLCRKLRGVGYADTLRQIKKEADLELSILGEARISTEDPSQKDTQKGVRALVEEIQTLQEVLNERN